MYLSNLQSKLHCKYFTPPTASQTEPAIRKVTTLGHRKGMTIATLTVNILLLHIDEIRMLVKELGIHILAVNETQLDDTIDDNLVNTY